MSQILRRHLFSYTTVRAFTINWDAITVDNGQFRMIFWIQSKSRKRSELFFFICLDHLTCSIFLQYYYLFCQIIYYCMRMEFFIKALCLWYTVRVQFFPRLANKQPYCLLLLTPHSNYVLLRSILLFFSLFH